MRAQKTLLQFANKKISPRMASGLCRRVASLLPLRQVALAPRAWAPGKVSRLPAVAGYGNESAGPSVPDQGPSTPSASAPFMPAPQYSRAQPRPNYQAQYQPQEQYYQLPPEQQPHAQPQNGQAPQYPQQPPYQQQPPRPQQQAFLPPQQRASSAYPPPQYAGSYQQRYPSSYQQPPGGAVPGGAANYATRAGGTARRELARVNPGKPAINTVMLMGFIAKPEQKSQRSATAIIEVPFATREGLQPFLLEAWDVEATHLMQLSGSKVVVEGRLKLDGAGVVMVVADRLKVVDESLPPSPVRRSRASEGAEPEERIRREALDPVKVWKTHYDTKTSSLADLAAHFGCAVKTVEDVLLRHAFTTKSPLRWGALAREFDLGAEGGEDDAESLLDYISLVTTYKEAFRAAAAVAQPGAVPPTPALTKDGMLRVRPIRDWALGRPQDDPYRYLLEQYQAKHDEGRLYSVLRLAVVGEATLGAWDPKVELAPQTQ